jgi:hypothetical protein
MAGSYASVGEVIELAPELSTVPPPQLKLLVEVITPPLLSAATWGALLKEGHRTLAAHVASIQLAPAGGGGGGGIVTSESFGEASRSYAVGPVSDAELSRTKYGQLHLQLRKTLPGAASFSAPNAGWELPDGRIL